MGYWSSHPLGGDTPSDCVFVIECIIFTNEERMDEAEVAVTEIKNRIANNLENFLKIDFYEEVGYSNDIWRCVIPFFIVENEFRISDKEMSKKFKDLIGDGGAGERGYDIPDLKDVDYPTAENNWNNLRSPYDYAAQLRDLWDDLMDGRLEFAVLGEMKGLLQTIGEAVEKGLVNKQ